MDDFIIRAYTKKELALMYFPDSSPRTAVMMAWIRRCIRLWDERTEQDGLQPQQQGLHASPSAGYRGTFGRALKS